MNRTFDRQMKSSNVLGGLDIWQNEDIKVGWGWANVRNLIGQK